MHQGGTRPHQEMFVVTIENPSCSDNYGTYGEEEAGTALVDLGRVVRCRDNDVDAMGVGAAATAPSASTVWTLSLAAACLMLACWV